MGPGIIAAQARDRVPAVALKRCCHMQGLGSTSGLTKLFCRVGNLAKGVIIGQAITIIWNIHPLFKKLISKFILS